MKDQLLKILAIIPVIFMLTIINTLIALVMGVAAFWQLNTVLGCSIPISKASSLLIAVGVYLYLWYLPKIKRFLT